MIDADLVRQLAQGATLRPLNPPVVTAEQALRYQPTAAVERFVRMRDLTCRFPGCDRPAQRCDIDHTIAFNHVNPQAGGKTVPANLKCLCRQHHRAKTFVQGWRDLQLPDGTVVWTTPDGRQLRTVPGGVELFPALAARPCAAPAPARCNPSRRRAHTSNAAAPKTAPWRPLNEAHRTLERARRREIEARKDRNRHRTMLMLFKGGRPTKSPFMRWVNEPYESEVLPPDWQPPPDPPPPTRRTAVLSLTRCGSGIGPPDGRRLTASGVAERVCSWTRSRDPGQFGGFCCVTTSCRRYPPNDRRYLETATPPIRFTLRQDQLLANGMNGTQSLLQGSLRA